MRIRQTLNSVVFFKKAKRKKTWDADFSHSELRLRGFERERESFSLKIRVIRPSADFGARRENDLCETGYAWTPVLVSFFKLFEVGFSPYLRFIPIFKGFSMFRLV